MSDGAGSPANIPQTSPQAFLQDHRDEVTAAISRVLASGSYILGEEVRAFELEFARKFELGGAVGVASGTDAVALALRCVGVGRGDRVATVSHTAVATVAAIEMVGASPVFVDIASDTYTIDPLALARTLRALDPVKAVIAVHLYGHPADVPAIMRVAHEHGVRVIEDCAQAHGAKIEGRYVGGMGHAAAFSFYPTKNLGALGDGGMVAANDPERVSRLRMLREYGWERRNISEVPGVNSRLDELQAAILRAKLPYLDAGNRRRAEIASAYNSGLADSGLLALPIERAGTTHVYHQYVVRHADRDGLQARLKQKGIGTNIHYPVPVHRQPAYAGRFDIDPGGLATTDAVAREVLSLPMFPELRDDAVARIIEAVRSAL